MLILVLSDLWRTNRCHCTTTIDVAVYASTIQLYQRRTSDRAGRVTYLVLTVTTINVCSDTRAGTEDMTASTCCIFVLTSDITLEDLYLSTVTYVTILSTTIDRTIDSRASTFDSTIFSRTTNINDSLVDISAIEVWHILVTR